MPGPHETLASVFEWVGEQLPQDPKKVRREIQGLIASISFHSDNPGPYLDSLRKIITESDWARDILRSEIRGASENRVLLTMLSGLMSGRSNDEIMGGIEQDKVQARRETPEGREEIRPPPLQRVLAPQPEMPVVKELPPLPPIDRGTRPVASIEHHGGREPVGGTPPPKGGRIGGVEASRAIAQAQAQEQRKQKVLEDVLEARERIEPPETRARRVYKQALQLSEETGEPLGSAAVELGATLAVRDISAEKFKQGLPGGAPMDYEPEDWTPTGKYGELPIERQPLSTFIQDPRTRVAEQARERALERRMTGPDLEVMEQAEGKRRATDRAVSRGYGYSDQPGMRGPFNVETYAARQKAVRRNLEPLVVQNKELRPEQKERYRKYGKKKDRRGRPILYTSPLDNVLGRRG